MVLQRTVVDENETEGVTWMDRRRPILKTSAPHSTIACHKAFDQVEVWFRMHSSRSRAQQEKPTKGKPGARLEPT